VDKNKTTYIYPFNFVNKQKGEDEKILDLDSIEDNEEALIKRTEKFQPNFMAFSVMKEILILD